jgi:hypothetical protein
MFDVMVDGSHQEMRGRRNSMQTFLYPAALQVRKSQMAAARDSALYVIRNGRLAQGWDEVARSGTTRAWPLHQQRRWGSIASMRLRSRTVFASNSLVDDDFGPHPAEFDRQYE